jgi:citrate synthase
MKLMFEITTGPYKASPIVIDALNKLHHADHEQKLFHDSKKWFRS